MSEGTGAVLAETFAALRPHLNERQRRLALGAAARALGRGGIRWVAGRTGWADSPVWRGVRELESGAEPSARVRTAGAGRRRLRGGDPGLVDALMALVGPDQRGDPESALRWTTKSTRNLAAELTRQGHRVGPDTVAALLKQEGFSLQATSRTSEGARHPDRDGQFHYINDRVEEFTAAGQPVVSVDTKKKEVLGEQRGRRTRVAPRGPAGAGPPPRGPGRGPPQGGSPTAPTTWPPIPAGWRSAATGTPPRSRWRPCAAGGRGRAGTATRPRPGCWSPRMLAAQAATGSARGSRSWRTSPTPPAWR